MGSRARGFSAEQSSATDEAFVAAANRGEESGFEGLYHRYRDWVISAFNQDMPYDLFVKAQIAGDLIDPDNKRNLIAGTGLFSLSPEFQEDRVDALTRGFLGLTVVLQEKNVALRSI